MIFEHVIFEQAAASDQRLYPFPEVMMDRMRINIWTTLAGGCLLAAAAWGVIQAGPWPPRTNGAATGPVLANTERSDANRSGFATPLAAKIAVDPNANSTPTAAVVQDDFGGSPWGRGQSPDYGRQADRGGVPLWENKTEFEKDVFVFARVQYSSANGGGWGRRGPRGGKWRIDYPDADLNLSYRLKELTSLEVDPNGAVVRLTDPELFDYPFIYLIEPGEMQLSEEEVKNLRLYLLKGGFLMVDDFWGEREWENFYREIKRVFPDREPVEVPLEHEIFHIVYDIKEKPIVPSVHAFLNGYTTERYDAEEAHYRAISDDDGRIMAMICHNTDLGDGWEREGVDERYFRQYSEKFAYPLGINIVTYAMTH